MELKTIIKKKVGVEGNEVIKTHNLATFHQTSNYAEYWEQTRGQPSYFISIMKVPSFVSFHPYLVNSEAESVNG